MSLIRVKSGIASNSLRFRKIWFQTPEDIALWAVGDDIIVETCCFDISAYRAIRLGDVLSATGNKGLATNARLLGNTFCQIAESCIEIMQADGVTILGNVAYAGKPSGGNSERFYTDNPGGAGVSASRVVATGNTLKDFKRGFVTVRGNITATANPMSNLTGPALQVGGGGVLSKIIFTGNPVQGTFDALGAINADSTGLVDSVIAANAFESTNAGVVAVINDTRTTGNDLSLGVNNGFTGLGTVVNRPRNNLTTGMASPVINLGTVNAGNTASFAVTVQGAAIGDQVALTSTNGARFLPAGVIVEDVSVSSANTVTVAVRNNNAANTTVPAFQAYVQVTGRQLV